MSEPTIKRLDSVLDNCIDYQLRVPNDWLVRVKHPRLRMTYWLLRMVWAPPTPSQAEGER